jgi:zinc protease
VESPPRPPSLDQPFRRQPPEADAEKPFVVPAAEHAKLRSGVPVIFAQQPSVSVAIDVVARGGLADVGADGVEILRLMTDGLMRGTTTHKMWQLDDVYATLYMPRPTSPWWADCVLLKLVAPVGKLKEVADLAAELILHPTFDQKELDYARDIDLRAYGRQLVDGAPIARGGIRWAIFGSHPYAGLEGSASRLRAVTRAQVVALHARIFDPSRLSIVVTGGVDEPATLDALDEAFGGLRTAVPSRAGIAPAAPQPSGTRLVVVDQPGSTIANVAMGVLAPPAAASDAEAAMIATQVLADGSMGRLATHLRDELGLVPGVSMSAYEARAGGILGWTSRAPTDRVARVLSETAGVMRALAGSGPSDDELAWARDREVYSLASSFETAGSAVNVFAWAIASGQTAESVAQRPQRYAAVTRDSARDAAARYLDADKLRAVIVGDWAALREPLLALGWGPIELRKADGTLVRKEGSPRATR